MFLHLLVSQKNMEHHIPEADHHDAEHLSGHLSPTQLFTGFLSQLQNLQLADLIGTGLAGTDNTHMIHCTCISSLKIRTPDTTYMYIYDIMDRACIRKDLSGNRLEPHF